MLQVKNELLPFHPDIIKCFGIQNKGKIFALSSETSLKFGILEGDNYTNFKFTQLPAKEGPKRHVSILIWSPSDEILAAISEVVTLWRFEKGAFTVVGDFREHCIDITSATWSPNSDFIAIGFINGNINIRKIDNSDIVHKLSIDGKVLALSWDPLDKYLVVLKNDNHLNFFKTSDFSLVESKSLMLGNSKLALSLKREDRKIAWSADYKSLLVPSLDDQILPFVASISRSTFSTNSSFIGPFSSINCVKFNPFFFRKPNKSDEGKSTSSQNDASDGLFQIFAMGDNDGNISIWRLPVNSQKLDEQPMWIFKSHPDSNQLIEDICWAENGKLLIAITLKKYLFLVYFEDECIGEKLSEEESNKIIESIYGIRAGEKRKIRVFKGTQPQDRIIEKTAKDFTAQSNLNQTVKVVFTEQTVSFTGGKKRIMPQIQKVIVEPHDKNPIAPASENNSLNVIKDLEIMGDIMKNKNEIEMCNSNDKQNKETNNPKNVMKSCESKQIISKEIEEFKDQTYNSTHNAIEDISKKLKVFEKDDKIEMLKKGITKQMANKKKSKKASTLSNPDTYSVSEEEKPIKKHIFLSTSRGTIEIENKSKASIIRKTIIINDEKIYLWSDCIQGNILLVDANDEMIIYFTDKKLLHAVNHDRKILCLPLLIPDITFLSAGTNGLFAICTKAWDIKLINIVKEEILVNENLKGILPDDSSNTISNIYIGKDGSFSIILSDFSVFCYNYGIKSWQKLSISSLELGIGNENNRKLYESECFSYQNPISQKLASHFEGLFATDREFQGDIWMKRLFEASQIEEKLWFFLQKNDVQNFLLESKRYISALISANETTRLLKYLEETIRNENSQESLFLARNNIPSSCFIDGVKDVLRSMRAIELLEDVELFLQ